MLDFINSARSFLGGWTQGLSLRIFGCISICLLSNLACSSIQKLENESYVRSPLVLKPIDSVTEILVESSTDPKFRKINKLTPDILIRFPEENWSILEPKERVYFQREILRRLPRSHARVHFPSSDRANLDGILTIAPEPDVDRYRFLVRLEDPFIDLEYYRTHLQWNPREKSSPVLVFWKEGSRISTPGQTNSPPERILFPEESEWNEAFQSTVMGKLNIYASSSDTTLRINGEPAGGVPLRDYKILNGIHRIEFQRPGFETVVRFIQVRAGTERNFIHEWEGDRNKASIQIQSFPQGLDVSINSSRKGRTNYYESEILPGAKKIQLGKSISIGKAGDKREYLYAEGTGVVQFGTLARFALPYNLESALSPENSEFWTPVGERGFRPIYAPYLGFAKATPVLLPGDYGYVSSYIFPMTLKWEGVWGELPSDGSRLLLVLMGEDRNIGIEAFGEEIALFDWEAGRKNPFRSIGVWKFKKDTKPEERRFQFEYRKNTDTPKLKITLGNREIYSVDPPRGEFWQIGILTRGEKFRTGLALQAMRLQYPDLVEWERKRERKE